MPKFTLRTKIIASLVGLALLTAGTCDAGEDPRTPGSRQDGGQAEKENDANEAKEAAEESAKANCGLVLKPADPPVEKNEAIVWFQTCVEAAWAPYTVVLEITNGPGAYPPNVPIVSGTWQHPIRYKKGIQLHIDMQLKPAKSGSPEGYCQITDGNKNGFTDFIHDNHGKGAHCFLNTIQ